MALTYLYIDDYNCIWWWANTSFVAWLNNNALLLEVLVIAVNAPLAILLIDNQLYSGNGYIRVGSLTFIDIATIGNP
jgi:hypothetical protein